MEFEKSSNTQKNNIYNEENSSFLYKRLKHYEEE
jgi:hypothetical protein